MTIRIIGLDEQPVDRTPVGVEMWYDRHCRNWVLYPVDAEGNQLKEARYGFGKEDALRIKAELEEEIANGDRKDYYYD